ncbi:MAG: hypothetical protein AMXMBFR53_13420 [Gemmatimonadota bacterium]
MTDTPTDEDARNAPGKDAGVGGGEARRRGCGCWWGGALAVLVVGAAALALWEARTSRLQAWYFTRGAAGLGFALSDGPAPEPVRAADGPYDVRLGYTRIPVLVERMDSLGFTLAAQARGTPGLVSWVERGAYPVYPAKAAAGLTVTDARGDTVVVERIPARAYAEFDSIPEVVWRSLLFIENRDFLDERYAYRNPAVDWVRLGRSVGELVLQKMGLERSVPGGSTLATQLEKFRHSPDGLTRTPQDKLRQMVSASLRAYQHGANTLEERREIVTDYLNSVPLSARPGHGEVIGTADGLWAWYGADVRHVNQLLRDEPTDSVGRMRKAEAYRKALSLLLAHRRPSYYLARAEGRAELGDLTDAYLGLMVRDRVIPRWLADAARQARGTVPILEQAPERPTPAFGARKASTLVRTTLLGLTGVPGLYDLDRMDLTARATVDLRWNTGTTRLLRSMADPGFVAQAGFAEARLLAVGDPAKVLYSVTLLERTPLGNALRIQTDNFEGPLSLSASSRLELGSTAKLRALVTYLEIVEEIHGAMVGLPVDSLRALDVPAQDRLARWVADQLLARPGVDVEGILAASLERTYSASPAERFVTGGGTQTFSNFDDQFDHRVLTVREAFRHSVNLPFIRLMRDVVAYEMFRGGAARVLEDESDPARQEYLVRFAEAEGASFVRQFYRKYERLSGPEVFDALVAERELGSRRMAWALRAVAPDADEAFFRDFIRSHLAVEAATDAALADLYRRADPASQTLSDLGFLARIHPLELWVASHVLHNPGASLQEVLDASREARVEVYGWLFRTRRRDAQDERIRSVLEMEAFQGVLRRWRRVGYPFENIVPSLGTAIGSSGDRPLALAELTGILLNGGVRLPVVRVEEIRLGEDTPFETRFVRRPDAGERVLSEAVAAAMRDVMVDVVENGTARRARGALVTSDGTPLLMGGKTGTGDNRFRVFAPGGALVSSRVVNRTSTFMFFAGDRYFGVVVAYVPGQDAESYRFTSALPTQLLRVLGARLDGLGDVGAGGGSESPPP